MNKPINKEYRQDLMNRAKVLGIGLVHINLGTRGGLTVAFKPSTDYNAVRMIFCAVKVCSIEDMFDKKIGATGAIEKFLAGQVIELPLLNMFSREDAAFAVKAGFTAMYQATTAY